MKVPTYVSLSIALLTLLTASPLKAKVASIEFSNLVATSDLIVVAKVESVSAPLILGKKYAKAKVTEVWKGLPVEQVKFLVSPTWTCDVSEAFKGETVLLFLNKRDQSQAYSIAHSGRGRWPLRIVGGNEYATFWPDVILPKDVATIAGPESKFDFIRSVKLDTLRELACRDN
jgi:hypothetical protein